MLGFLADLVAVLHLGYVGFVVIGLLLILAGWWFQWQWVRNRWFRLIHMTMIGIVVVEALLGIVCPLTTLENFLRQQAGQSIQAGSFVGRLVHGMLFYDFSPRTFTILYCGFGAAVLASWFLVPPRPLRQSR